MINPTSWLFPLLVAPTARLRRGGGPLMHPSPVAPPIMNLQTDVERLVAAHNAVRSELLGERTVGGHWVGELSSSPLATAAAVSRTGDRARQRRLRRCRRDIAPERTHLQNMLQGDLSELIVESLHWLAERQNADGGWGDTERGRSNIAATLLVQSAFRLTGVPAKYEGLTDRADEFLESQGGIAAFRKRYGRDKSLSAPILANAALAGLVPWRQVPALPFEYTSLPQKWYGYLQLPVVSYAIPVLVAVGQLKFHHDPPRNPITRVLRMAARKRSLAVDRADAARERRLPRIDAAHRVRRDEPRQHRPGTASDRATRRRIPALLGAQRRQLADRLEPGHVEHDPGDERARAHVGADVR